jgi:hypothetical protein
VSAAVPVPVPVPVMVMVMVMVIVIVIVKLLGVAAAPAVSVGVLLPDGGECGQGAQRQPDSGIARKSTVLLKPLTALTEFVSCGWHWSALSRSSGCQREAHRQLAGSQFAGTSVRNGSKCASVAAV